MSLYVQWLSTVVDTTDAATVEMLDSMSCFDSLIRPTTKQYIAYARNWCQLSQFLFAHREEQLYSGKVQMLFDVEERNQRTDLYWCEVARSCDMAANETMVDLLQDLGIMGAVSSQQKGYAETALRLTPHQLAKALRITKDAIGACHYTLTKAKLQCKFLASACPVLMASITRRYNSFRVVGCYVAGVYNLLEKKDAQAAADWFATSADIGKSNEVSAGVAPLLLSTSFLIVYAFQQKAVREGQRGIATGLLRELSRFEQIHPSTTERLHQELAVAVGSSSVQVPPPGSPLLKIDTHVNPRALEEGTSPFHEPIAALRRCIVPEAR